MKYSFDARVGYSEISDEGYMKAGSVIDRFQDCSNFQSESLGVGWEYLSGINRVWVLNSWQIIFDKQMKMGDNIKVSTWAYGFDKLFGYRNFMITDEKGEKCVRAASRWVLIDPKTMRPLKISPQDVEMYETEEKLEMDYGKRKIAVPEDLSVKENIKVRRYQIDTNGHMNNAWYVKIAMEYIENKKNVRQLRAEYRKSAVISDIIRVKVHSENNNSIVVLCDEKDAIYSIVEFEF